MGIEVHPRSGPSRRTVMIAIATSALLVLLVAGLAFSNSIGATRVTGNARALHWTNASIGTTALARAGLVQAVTFVALQDRGLATAEDVRFAMDQVATADEEMTELIRGGTGHPSLQLLDEFESLTAETVTALEADDPDAARSLVVGEVETTYVTLSDSLQEEQTSIQAAIDENTAIAARLNNYLLFFVVFAVPGTAVVVYWLTLRRQVRELKLKSELDLDAERAINRGKDQFIAGISHELRTPLTSIYGFAEILADNANENTAEHAQIIVNEAAELTRMVDDLLAASRLGSTGVEVDTSATKLGDVIEAAVTPFEHAGSYIQREPTDIYLTTDASRLRHVLINLLSNALRHGGDSVGVEASQADGKVEIKVWDDGPGVPEGMVGKIFDPFIHDGSAPLLTGSVGLGLAVASRLTALLGGRLAYQRSGPKTFFVVTLPIEESTAWLEVDTTDGRSVDDMTRALSR